MADPAMQQQQPADATMGQDQDDQGASAQQDQDQGGVRIYIDCAPGGTFEVGSMPIPADESEDEGQEKQAASFGDALKAALMIYRENSPGDSTAQQQFESGYKKGGA